jgi:hypothetical protein
MFEDIEGHLPAQPWAADELARVLEAVAGLAVALTPAPIDAPAVADRFGEQFRGWRRLSPKPGAAVGTTWLAWPRGRAVTWRTWPRWRTAGTLPPQVARWSMPTCERTTCC